MRRLPDENVKEVLEAGLFKVLQPSRVGGYELDLHTHIDVIEAVGRGCASTAWVLGVCHVHSWLMGCFPQEAQDECYGVNPDAIISAVIGPRGRAQRVDGGYKLKGFWPFCSGVAHADWVLLGGMVHDESGEVCDDGDFLIRRSDIEVKDDWHVTGLRATGSSSVVVDDLFIPEHRFLSFPELLANRAPGRDLHSSSLYKGAAVPFLTFGVATPALGIAHGAIDAFKDHLKGRQVAYTFGEVQSEMPTTHMQIADASSRLQAARALLHVAADEISELAESGEEMSMEMRARIRMDSSFAARLCLEGVEKVYLAGGGSAIQEKNPLQLASRDLHAINMHGLLNRESNLEIYGRVLLGLKPSSPVI
jgi:3-hydroxy-9,10-secoandrosta-1,3,5(10)-triene-9,17-dione monooxygenase